MKLNRPLVFFDLETTGVNHEFDHIIEASFLRVEPDGSTSTWTGLFDPGIPIAPEASKVNGITDDMVKGKPAFGEKVAEIYAFIKGCDLAGHNIIRFDVPFLESHFREYEFDLETESRLLVDTQKIYHHFHTRTLTDAVRTYLGRKHGGAHRAMADVEACFDVLEAQLRDHAELPETVRGLDEFCRPIVADNVDRDGKLTWVGDEVAINFGKHKGSSLRALMASGDRGYLEWILKQDFSSRVKHVARQALKGSSLHESDYEKIKKLFGADWGKYMKTPEEIREEQRTISAHLMMEYQRRMAKLLIYGYRPGVSVTPEEWEQVRAHMRNTPGISGQHADMVFIDDMVDEVNVHRELPTFKPSPVPDSLEAWCRDAL